MNSQEDFEATIDATSTPYYIMILCHSIAISDEMQLEKFVKKFKLRVIEDRQDQEANEVLEIFQNKDFKEVMDLVKY